MSQTPTEPSLYALCACLIASLPWRFASLLPARLRWHLGQMLGIACFALSPKRRSIARRNLAACFPQHSKSERNRLALECFRHAGNGLLSKGFAMFASPARIAKEVHWKDLETVDSLIDGDASVVLLCPRFASEMVALRAFSERSALVVMQDSPDRSIFDLGFKVALEGDRSDYGWMNLLYRKRSANSVKMTEFGDGPVAMLEALENGIPFYFSPDANALIDEQRVFAPFFGMPVATYSFLSMLAGRARSRILMCYPVLLPKGGGFDLHVALLPEDFIEGDAQQDARRINSAVEKLVSDNPEQYRWFHRRFKNLPLGEERLSLA